MKSRFILLAGGKCPELGPDDPVPAGYVLGIAEGDMEMYMSADVKTASDELRSRITGTDVERTADGIISGMMIRFGAHSESGSLRDRWAADIMRAVEFMATGPDVDHSGLDEVFAAGGFERGLHTKKQVLAIFDAIVANTPARSLRDMRQAAVAAEQENREWRTQWAIEDAQKAGAK